MCYPGELGFFFGESTLFLGEGAPLPKELGRLLVENSLFPWGVFFFFEKLFSFHGGLAWD